MRQSIDPYYYFTPKPDAAAPPPKLDYLLGVDLAQVRDFTAIGALERITNADGATFHVRDLERFRDRSYVDIARHIRGLVEALRTPQQGPGRSRSWLTRPASDGRHLTSCARQRSMPP
jgi:hypothetical protein